jgi:NAD(P)-dependent dehydrogenase (short-subunit alcohol dehydrogenase family)
VMARLRGKRTLITGGTSGIGLETAKQFLAEGARVVVTGANPASIERAKAELGSDILVIKADSTNLEEQKALAQSVKDHYGQLDAVFVNAGVSIWQPIEAWDEAAYDRMFATNVKGPFFLMQALLPVLANPASVIMNASMYVHGGTPRSSVYSATKGAILTFAKTMSGELLPRGVRVNAISCGPIDTPLFDKLGIPDAYREQAAQQILSTIPVGSLRPGERGGEGRGLSRLRRVRLDRGRGDRPRRQPHVEPLRAMPRADRCAASSRRGPDRASGFGRSSRTREGDPAAWER